MLYPILRKGRGLYAFQQNRTHKSCKTRRNL
jgi:hypothetical protein